MMLKKYVLTFLFMLGVFTNALGFSISSEDFDQRIDTGGYKEFVFENKGDKPIRYKFEVNKGNGDKDMSEWVTLYPKVMNIPPMEKRVLKVHAQSPAGTKPGEYSFNLMITPLVVPTLKESDGKISLSSSLSFVPIIEMLGYVGNANFEQNLNLTDVRIKKLDEKKIEVTGLLENKAHAGINVGLKFVDWNGSIMDGKYVGRIPKNRNSRIRLELEGRVKKVDDIKEIILYDANDLVNIKTIKL